MKVIIHTTEEFDKALKKLSKKYPAIKNDIDNLLEDILKKTVSYTDLGSGFFKIRFSISGKSAGKRGGARMVWHNLIVSIHERRMTLIIVYDKSEVSHVKVSDLKAILNEFKI